MMALALRVARERHVFGTPRAVPHRDWSVRTAPRWAPRPRPPGAADPCRPTPSAARRAASASTSAIRVGGASRAAPAEAATTCLRESSSRGPQRTIDGVPWTSCRPRRDLAECSGGQRLFGQAAPGLSSANGRRSSLRSHRAPGGTSKGNGISAIRRRRAPRSELQVLFDDVMPRRGTVVALAVERPRPRSRSTPREKPITRAAPEKRARARRT